MCMNWVLLTVKTKTTSFVKVHYFLIYKLQLYLLYIYKAQCDVILINFEMTNLHVTPTIVDSPFSYQSPWLILLLTTSG